VDVTRLLLERGAAVDAADSSGSTALGEAASKGHDDVVELLIAHGASVNVRNGDTGATPLHEAAVKGHVEVVQVLLRHGADPAATDKAGATPLDEALRYRQSKVVGLLMDKTGGFSGASAMRQLQDAVLRGQVEMVALLLEKGADPNSPTPNGGTLLHDAALKGHREIVELLLRSGARVNALNGAGGTALHDAALGGFRPVVELLIGKGADLEIRERETGATALHQAASWGRTEAVEALLAAGADPNAPNKTGITCLQAAVANGQTEAAALLRRYIKSPSFKQPSNQGK
jgi:cytohesin